MNNAYTLKTQIFSLMLLTLSCSNTGTKTPSSEGSKETPPPVKAKAIASDTAKGRMVVRISKKDTQKTKGFKVAGKRIQLKRWGVSLKPTPEFLKKFKKRPLPHISGKDNKSGQASLEAYSFDFSYDRQHNIFVQLRKVQGTMPSLSEELKDAGPLGKKVSIKGKKGGLQFAIGYKNVRGAGHCARGRCMHMLVSELNGIALLPLKGDFYIKCHVSIIKENNPNAPRFIKLFDICRSLKPLNP
ncbi:MAG: hypothetical protein PF689_01950 [Deltaproteobacteria bacterium]|jgi:hypothetical protein|nr:hypothetical protein [Deltaproteobacteria bacterium]